MSRLSIDLARAVASSRRSSWKPASREEVLARLLVKRAEAKQAGLFGLEESLREQITWSLPMRAAGNDAIAASHDDLVHDRL